MAASSHPARALSLSPSLVYGAGYEYNNYYGSMGAGMNGSVADNGSGQQGNSSPNDASNYDHDNHYGKAKAAVVTSPHSYPIS